MFFKDLAKHFTESFEEYMPVLQEHIDFNGEFLNHVFFGECNDYFIELIVKEKDTHKIHALFDLLERMATQGDDDVKELLSVTVLARFGDSKRDSKNLLQTSYKYMGAETRKFSDEVEKFWGRY